MTINTPKTEKYNQSLTTPEIREAAANIIMNWKLAIFDAESNRLKALKKTREQIEKVESVNLLSYNGYTDGKNIFAIWARVESNRADGTPYMTRIHKSGSGLCECRDNIYRRRNCKHLVRFAIEILDGEPKGPIYIV